MVTSSSFRISSLGRAARLVRAARRAPLRRDHEGDLVTLGEPVLIIHPDDHPADLSADTVLIGPPAAEVIAAATARDAA